MSFSPWLLPPTTTFDLQGATKHIKNTELTQHTRSRVTGHVNGKRCFYRPSDIVWALFCVQEYLCQGLEGMQNKTWGDCVSQRTGSGCWRPCLFAGRSGADSTPASRWYCLHVKYLSYVFECSTVELWGWYVRGFLPALLEWGIDSKQSQMFRGSVTNAALGGEKRKTEAWILRIFPCRSKVSGVVVALSTSKTSSSLPWPFSEQRSRHFIMTEPIWCLWTNTFLSCRKEFTRAFNHSTGLNWQIHIRDGFLLHFPHFYCCSSAYPCITLRNGTACTLKWTHILHGHWDPIMCL